MNAHGKVKGARFEEGEGEDDAEQSEGEESGNGGVEISEAGKHPAEDLEPGEPLDVGGIFGARKKMDDGVNRAADPKRDGGVPGLSQRSEDGAAKENLFDDRDGDCRQDGGGEEFWTGPEGEVPSRRAAEQSGSGGQKDKNGSKYKSTLGVTRGK